MKKQTIRIIAIVFIVLGTLSPAYAQAKLPRFVEIGTAGTGGAYYPIGIAMADILTQKLKIQATAQVTGGAVENIRLIQEGSVKIALTTTANAYRGLKGLPPFTKPSPRVGGLFSNLTLGVYQIAVRENAGIKTLQDLKGKRVSLGPQGGLGVELSDYVFKAAGFSIADVKATFLSYEESATMMDDGNLDAVIIQTALPNPALRQLQSTGKKFNVISLPADVIKKVSSDHPYFESFAIPASMYNTAGDVMTLNGTNMAIVDMDLSEDVVYQIMKALMEDIDKIRASQPAAKGFNLEKAAIMPIPIHPGAERYYREHNVIK
ncbi:MAG: TAXI family TRAP transporter solute-binding subunit [Desulfocucumaceae bacterium]